MLGQSVSEQQSQKMLKTEKYGNAECTCGMILAKAFPFLLALFYVVFSLLTAIIFTSPHTHTLLASLNILLQSTGVQKTLEEKANLLYMLLV
jgi:hypothetical protein